MHPIQEEIGLPRLKTNNLGEFHAIFTLGPLPTGYGVTLGNAIRRVLLSSIPGVSITAVKIDGISHEYSTVKGVKESVLDITLNLRMINFKKVSKEPVWITLSANKEGKIFAKDIKAPSDIEILTPNVYITTIDKGGKINMEIKVEKGVGYIPASLREKEEVTPNLILMDAVFTPIKKIRYDIEPMRVGQMTNLDKLTLEIKTNGSITPEDALKFASNILQSYFGLFNKEGLLVEQDFIATPQKILEHQEQTEQTKPVKESYTPIEILGFSPRTLNALINGGIGSIEQLSKCSQAKLSNLRGFGKKALNEVLNALAERNIQLSEE